MGRDLEHPTEHEIAITRMIHAHDIEQAVESIDRCNKIAIINGLNWESEMEMIKVKLFELWEKIMVS